MGPFVSDGKRTARSQPLSRKAAPLRCFYCGDAEQKRLYLTFDAGYENGNTAPILDALKKHNAPGTFFVVGSYIKENPDLIKRMVAEGHTVGNHTYHHPNMSQKDEASFKKELNDLAALFQETTGTPLPLFYRPPEGKFSDENLTWAQELGYKTTILSHSEDVKKQNELIDTAIGKKSPGYRSGIMQIQTASVAAIEKAKKTGAGIVSVRESNHFGIAGFMQKWHAIRLIGMACTNSEAIMVPTFGKKAMLGSNPIAVAMPADPYPFFFDCSTTVVTRGNWRCTIRWKNRCRMAGLLIRTAMQARTLLMYLQILWQKRVVE